MVFPGKDHLYTAASKAAAGIALGIPARRVAKSQPSESRPMSVSRAALYCGAGFPGPMSLMGGGLRPWFGVTQECTL